MKKGIHPKMQKVKATCQNCGAVFTVYTTLTQDFSISTCSQCHPTYTGNYSIAKKASQIEKFLQRQKKAQAMLKKQSSSTQSVNKAKAKSQNSASSK